MFSSRFWHSRRGSALFVGLLFTLIIVIMISSFIDKTLRFSRSSKGIEQSTQAYYHATSIIEKQLFETTELLRRPWTIQNASGSQLAMNGSVHMHSHTGSTTIPKIWLGNSRFDSDYNLIAVGEPVQIVIPENINWGNVRFEFRLPNHSGSHASLINPLFQSSGAILWGLMYTGASLYPQSPDEMIRVEEIGTPFSIALKQGEYMHPISLTWTIDTVSGFYGAFKDNCEHYQCTLRLSLLRPISLSNGSNAPILEYKIIFDEPIPNQYMVLDARGHVWDYIRDRRVLIPQITTHTALDFAVLQ